MRDWKAWHAEYDDPTSRLGRRLAVVRSRLADVLDRVERPDATLLALCAGEARDVVPVLAARRDGDRIAAVLVELDQGLAGRAEAEVRSAHLPRVEIRRADAGDPASFRDVVPVDVLMLCGIFGNVEHEAVRTIAQAVPAMVRAGGFVIWTRGADATIDRRPEVRRWFIELGMPEASFDGHPETYGVGVNRITTTAARLADRRLFTFESDRR
jgi:hypothetical protein